MDKTFCFAALVAGLICLGLAPVGNVSAAERNPCSEDIAKFCKNVKPGGGAVIECLEKHEKELSDACRAYEETMGGGRTERREGVRHLRNFRNACGNDVVKFCKDVKPGGGGIVRCLKEHTSELSVPCKAALTEMKEEEGKDRK